MGDTKPFFVTGFPKSGTTFLQRLVNLHPAISCPSEQGLVSLEQSLGALLGDYGNLVKLIDQRTGGQGAPVITGAIRRDVFRGVVTALSSGFAGGKPIHGLNDNRIFLSPSFTDEVFDGPKIVVIFRDPVDCALSAWRHNHRLAREEKERAQMHLSLLNNPKGTAAGFAEVVATRYRPFADAMVDYARDRANFLLLRYEDLAVNVAGLLPRILDFLGAEKTPEIVAAMTAGSSKQAMARTSRSPAFFGVGADAGPPVTIDAAERARLKLLWLTPALASLGYA